MLNKAPIHPSLATGDLARAKAWYSDKLGLDPVLEVEGLLLYRVGAGSFSIYETPAAGTARNTVAIWTVDDLRGEMARLRARGVAFEEYDFGELRTVNGVMSDPDGALNAWFKDRDGNIISILQTPEARMPRGISAMLAAADLERAIAWYRDRLGFEPVERLEGVIAFYLSGDQPFSLYRTEFAGTAKNTVAVWRVDDLRREVAELRARGVAFEDYDFGDGDRTVDGVMDAGDGDLNAWFTDSEGNILGIAATHSVTIPD